MTPAALNRLTELMNAGHYAEAESQARLLVEQHPNFGIAWKILAGALTMQGKDAVRVLHRTSELLPDDPDTHYYLGNALQNGGRLADAVASYGRALEIKPQFAEAHNNLGIALGDLGHLHEAMASFRQALRLKPDYAAAHSNLGNVLLDLQQLDEAANSYRRALAIKADDAESLTALSVVLRLQGRAAEAEANCRRALEMKPDLATAVTFLGEILADQGQFAEADDLFRRAIAIDPDLTPAWANIPRYRKMESGDTTWLTATQRLAEQPQPLRHRIGLRYAIGKYFDDVKDYEQAFHNYQLANELSKRFGIRHDRQQLTRLVDQLKASYSQSWLGLTRSWADPSKRPVFIVGMPRSGTSLAEQILDSHAAVFGAGELDFWNMAAATIEPSALTGNDSPGAISGLGPEYLRKIEALSADALRVVDKMPSNFMNLGLIHAALPNARIIHLRRNPIDTCLSIYFQHFSTAHAYANDLEDLAHYYTEYFRLLQHWRSALPEGVMLDLPYDGLVEEPEIWTRKMVDFTGLPWDPSCLDFHLTYRTVITTSQWQVRQKISKASVGRWRNYEQFIGPLRRLIELDPNA